MEDIEGIIDELEDELLTKRRGILTGKFSIDQVKVTELLSKLRESIPRSFREAMSMVKEEEKYISEVEEKASRIIKSANEMKERLVSESNIITEAKQRADAIVEDAETYRDKMYKHVQEGLNKFLVNTEQNLEDAIDFIRNMREDLDRRAADKKPNLNN